MSYSFKVFIFQTNPGGGAYFRVVEKTVWQYGNGGTWDEVDGYNLLKIGSSGTCGSLRLLSDTGEIFVVTLGIDSNVRWGDIVTDLTNSQTACVITPEYYNSQDADKEKQRTSHLTVYEIANLKGRTCSYEYTVTEGYDLEVRIVIS